MFCKNCGKELADGVTVCPACGANITEITDDSSATMSVEKEKLSGNIISKIWNHPLFTKLAIKFGYVLDILMGIIYLILSKLLFQEDSFLGNVFGVTCLLAGFFSCAGGIISLLSRKNKDESKNQDEASINKKKRNLCIGAVVLFIALIVIINTGGGTYSIVKSITFDDMGSETIGELVDKNIKNPKWSQEKLDSSFRLVYVEGYCPKYGETIRIEFHYEKVDKDSYEVSLRKIYWPDSGEEFDAFETAVVWASFYN